MRYYIRLLVLFSFVVSMTACATQPYNHIDREARAHFESVESYLVVPQDEIYADIQRSNITGMMGGGLLWALVDASVDNSRTKDAETAIAPIRNKLLNYDFAEILATNINTKLMGVDWLNSTQLVLERARPEDFVAKKYEACNASAILFINADYKLSDDFGQVITSVNMEMFANVAELKKYREGTDDNQNPVDTKDNIYRNIITVSIPLGVEGKKKEIVEKLVSDECSAVKTALEESAKQIAEKIYNDIMLDETADKKG